MTYEPQNSGPPNQPAAARVGKYLMLDLLGEGAFGKVRLAVDESDGFQYAMKIMDKSHIKANELTLQVRREIAVMKAMRHPNIVNLHEVLTSSKNLYMVMDLVTGGELFDAVAEAGRLPEARSRLYFQQLVDGIQYCHTRGVYHRDLKPENLLLTGDKQTVKITDFGLSSIKAHNASSELLYTIMGSPHYIAPEIITSASAGYDGAKVDVWASGIILFGMLAGFLPFDEPNTRALYSAIVHNAVSYPPHFSYDVIKLLRAMLQKDPNKRPTMEEIKSFAWFKVDYTPAVMTPSSTATSNDNNHTTTSNHHNKTPSSSSATSGTPGESVGRKKTKYRLKKNSTERKHRKRDSQKSWKDSNEHEPPSIDTNAAPHSLGSQHPTHSSRKHRVSATKTIATTASSPRRSDYSEDYDESRDERDQTDGTATTATTTASTTTAGAGASGGTGALTTAISTMTASTTTSTTYKSSPAGTTKSSSVAGQQQHHHHHQQRNGPISAPLPALVIASSGSCKTGSSTSLGQELSVHPPPDPVYRLPSRRAAPAAPPRAFEPNDSEEHAAAVPVHVESLEHQFEQEPLSISFPTRPRYTECGRSSRPPPYTPETRDSFGPESTPASTAAKPGGPRDVVADLKMSELKQYVDAARANMTEHSSQGAHGEDSTFSGAHSESSRQSPPPPTPLLDDALIDESEREERDDEEKETMMGIVIKDKDDTGNNTGTDEVLVDDQIQNAAEQQNEGLCRRRVLSDREDSLMRQAALLASVDVSEETRFVRKSALLTDTEGSDDKTPKDAPSPETPFISPVSGNEGTETFRTPTERRSKIMQTINATRKSRGNGDFLPDRIKSSARLKKSASRVLSPDRMRMKSPDRQVPPLHLDDGIDNNHTNNNSNNNNINSSNAWQTGKEEHILSSPLNTASPSTSSGTGTWTTVGAGTPMAARSGIFKPVKSVFAPLAERLLGQEERRQTAAANSSLCPWVDGGTGTNDWCIDSGEVFEDVEAEDGAATPGEDKRRLVRRGRRSMLGFGRPNGKIRRGNGQDSGSGSGSKPIFGELSSELATKLASPRHSDARTEDRRRI